MTSQEDLPCPAIAIVKGDGKVPQISAASILAKTARDRLMLEMDEPIRAMALPSTRDTA